jgi:hypothetical protein
VTEGRITALSTPAQSMRRPSVEAFPALLGPGTDVPLRALVWLEQRLMVNGTQLRTLVSAELGPSAGGDPPVPSPGVSPSPSATPSVVPSATATPPTPTPTPTSTPLPGAATMAVVVSPARPFVGERFFVTVRIVNVGTVPIRSPRLATGLAALSSCAAVELPRGASWHSTAGDEDRVEFDADVSIRPAAVWMLRWMCEVDAGSSRVGPAIPVSLESRLSSMDLAADIRESVVFSAPWPASLEMAVSLNPSVPVEGAMQEIVLTVSNVGQVPVSDANVDIGTFYGLGQAARLFAQEGTGTVPVVDPPPVPSGFVAATLAGTPLGIMWLADETSPVSLHGQLRRLEISTLPAGAQVEIKFWFQVGADAAGGDAATTPGAPSPEPLPGVSAAVGAWLISSFPTAHPKPDSGLVSIKPVRGSSVSVSVTMAPVSTIADSRAAAAAAAAPATPAAAAMMTGKARSTTPLSVVVTVSVRNGGPRGLDGSGLVLATNIAALLADGTLTNATANGHDVARLPASFGDGEPSWKSGPVPVGGEWNLTLVLTAHVVIGANNGSAALPRSNGAPTATNRASPPPPPLLLTDDGGADPFDRTLTALVVSLPPGLADVSSADNTAGVHLENFLRGANGLAPLPSPQSSPVGSPSASPPAGSPSPMGPSSPSPAPEPTRSPSSSPGADGLGAGDGSRSDARGGGKSGGFPIVTVLLGGSAFLLIVVLLAGAMMRHRVLSRRGHYASLSTSVELGSIVVPDGFDGPAGHAIVEELVQPPDTETRAAMDFLEGGLTIASAATTAAGAEAAAPVELPPSPGVPPRGDRIGFGDLLEHDYDDEVGRRGEVEGDPDGIGISVAAAEDDDDAN